MLFSEIFFVELAVKNSALRGHIACKLAALLLLAAEIFRFAES